MWWQQQQGREGKCEGVEVGWPDLGSRSSSVALCRNVGAIWMSKRCCFAFIAQRIKRTRGLFPVFE